VPPVSGGIDLKMPSEIKAGQDILAHATLIGYGPIAGARLHFIVDGSESHTEVTDDTGTAHLKLRGIIPAGTHQIDVYYGIAGASGTVVVTPLSFKAKTVPAVAGVTVTLDDSRSAVSDSNGDITFSVETAGMHSLKASMPPDQEKTRYTFARWSDDAIDPVRQVRIEQDTSMSVGLRIAYLTSISFGDLDGGALDPARVSDVALSGPNAEIMKLSHPYPPVWLQTAMPAKYTGEVGLHVTPAPYAVSTAYYDSLNVASQGRERYLPVSPGTWTVKLLLFRLKLHARDAILGSSLSQPVTLTSPSGWKQTLQLNRDGEATVVLGRGNYIAFVHASGVSPLAPIALSKSQTAVIPVITPIDLMIVLLICLLVLVPVFALGRGEALVLGSLRRLRLRLNGRKT
jgi:hypothetical protein